MNEGNGHAGAGNSLDAVRSAAESLLERASSPELAASFLFPYGVTRIAISVKAEGAEVNVEISGPEKPGTDDEDFRLGDDEDDLWLDEELDPDEDDDEL